ncbi:hypothetical protein [Propioniciclava sp.]|uniref:hypothetical protein n=1 Tax=Propioniciclava sp. TaxID=2038686 RepID=UPI002605AC27|nr:hypothetical protein [Propioniciclava sp.]
MPTYSDPHADAREASEAIRGLAHATQHVEDPDVLYPIIGETLATTRRLGQVLDQLARAHQHHTGRATTDDGDPAAGSQLAFETAAALHEASALVDQADTTLDRAFNRAGRIAWQPARDERWISVVFLQGGEADPVIEMIDRQGTDAAIEFLAGWDAGDETVQDALENGYVYDTPPQTPADRVATRDVYALTYSPDLGYVGLTRQIDTPPDPDLLGIDTPVQADAPAAKAPAVGTPAAEEPARGRHRGQDRRDGSWFLPDAIADVAEARGITR